MPEPKKVTLKGQLSAEVEAIVAERPDLHRVKVADGAEDNWRLLSHELSHSGDERLDCYHACEHLKNALDAAYGERSAKANAQYEKPRGALLEELDGAGKLIRALRHRRDQGGAHRAAPATELNYFRKHRHRMDYARARGWLRPLASAWSIRDRNALACAGATKAAQPC